MGQHRDHRGRFVTDARLNDGLANVASGAGLSADKRSHAFYMQPFMLPEQIEAAYRSSWFVQKGVDLPPFDMTRERRDWQLDEADVAKIEKEEKRLQVWAKVRQALTLGRLGGGLIVMGVGNDPSVPLDRETVAAGGLKYLHVLNRWQVTLGPIVTDPADPLFCQPSYFAINFGRGGSQQVTIHPSRVIAFRGKMRPNLSGGSSDDWFWGDSVLVAANDAVKNADAAMNGFASLIEEAKVDTVTIPGLTALVATQEGEQLLLRRVGVANQMKSNHNTRILDGGASKDSPGETWETRQIAWTGMPDMIRTYAAAVAGAFDIPATRFLGKSPDGMNASGASDENNYIAKIRADQDGVLRPALDQLDAALLPSAGVTITDEAWYDFPPLQEMSELDKSTIFKNRLDGLTALQATGTIPDVAFSKAVQHTAVEEQWLSGLDGALAEIPDDERFPEPDDLTDPSVPVAEPDPNATPQRRAANDRKRWALIDAEPRTLYVRRDVVNAADLVKWAKAQGFTDIVPDLHVTIAYSTTPIDWMKAGNSWSAKLEVAPGGPRLVEGMGPDGKYKALLFTADELVWRNQAIRDAGASWDWPEYQPHISIQIGGDIDLTKVAPYAGKIVLGPEIFEEVRTGDDV